MDLIKLLDVANPKKIKTTINALITTYEGFDDEIRATAKSAVDIANAAKTTAQSAEDTAEDAKSIVTTANANASAAKQTSEEALAMIEQADARSQEATTTAETALTNANDATSTAELAMNVATEAKSTVDQAISTGVFGTFVHNPAGISLLHAYMTHNLAQEDTDENFYIATPKLVRTALTEYYTKTQTDNLLANLDLSSYPTKTELKEYSYPVTADDAWIYNSTTKKLGGSGGSVSNTYNPLQGSTQNFGTLARVSQVSRIATAHNDLVDIVNNKQDKLTAGSNITISEDNTISAKDTTYTAGNNITISDSNVISAAKTSVVQETGTSTESVMSQDAVTKELTAITTALSNKFSNHAQSAYNCNTCYDEGVYLIANGSNCPSGSQYGSLFVMPYRKPTGNAKPDFTVQIFIPNGDDGSKPNSMFYRTSLADSWNTWQEVATTAELNKKFNYGAQLSATDDLNNLTTGIYILNQDAGEEQHYPTGAYQDFTPVSIMHTEYGMVAYQVIFAGKNGSTTSTGSPRLFLRYKQKLLFGIAWGTWQELNPATLALKSEIHEYVPDVVQSTGTSTADIMSQNAVTTELNKKADLYKWTNINVTYDSASTGTHTIDISSAISGWQSGAVYEVVWIMEAYCVDTAYLKAYTDMFSNNYSDQRFSSNGRQGGRIYTLPCHRYLYYNITTRSLNPCKGAVVAYRRLY